MATFSDDFDRADAGTLGASWTEDATGFSIVSNAADSDGTSSVAWYATVADSDDNYSEVTIGTANANANQVFCRGDGNTGSPTAYGAQCHSVTPLITKYVSGTRTTLTSDWGGLSVNDLVKIEANGSTITAYHNGSSAATLTDTSITTGTYLGFRAAANAMTYRAWNGGDLSTAVEIATGAQAETVNRAAALGKTSAVTTAAQAETVNRAAAVAKTSAVTTAAQAETVTTAAAVDATKTVAGTAEVTATLAAAIDLAAGSFDIDGTLAVTNARAAAVDATKTVAGTQPETVTTAAAIDATKTLAGTATETVNRAAAISKTSAVTTSAQQVTATATADIAIPIAGVAHVSTGALAAAAATSVEVTLPTHTTGDLIVVVGGGREDSTADALDISGWTDIGSQAFLDLGTSAITLHAWYKFAASGAEANPTITGAGSATGGCFGFAVVYRNVDTSTPLSGVTPLEGTSAAAATFTPPSITPDSASTRLVVSVVASADDNNLSLSTPQSFTDRASGTSYHTTTGLDIAFALGDRSVTTASAVTLPTYTQNAVGNDAWAYKSFVLRPSSAITIDGTRSVTVTVSAATAKTSTLAGTQAETVNRAAAVAKTSAVTTGATQVTATRAAAVAKTSTVAGSQAVTATLAADIEVATPSVTIDGTQAETVTTAAAVDKTSHLVADRTTTAGRAAALDKTTPSVATQTATVAATASLSVTKAVAGTVTVTVATDTTLLRVGEIKLSEITGYPAAVHTLTPTTVAVHTVTGRAQPAHTIEAADV